MKEAWEKAEAKKSPDLRYKKVEGGTVWKARTIKGRALRSGLLALFGPEG